MNLSIKPFLILTSSPQMASLIYPFPRILAVHLKYATANTSRKQSWIAKGVLVFQCLCLTLSGHIRLITCPSQCADMIKIPQQASVMSLKTRSFVCQLVVSPFFPCQFLVTAWACSKSRSWCCSTSAPLQVRLLIFVFIFKGFSLGFENLEITWHFYGMPHGTQPKQKYVAHSDVLSLVYPVVCSLHTIKSEGWTFSYMRYKSVLFAKCSPENTAVKRAFSAQVLDCLGLYKRRKMETTGM